MLSGRICLGAWRLALFLPGDGTVRIGLAEMSAAAIRNGPQHLLSKVICLGAAFNPVDGRRWDVAEGAADMHRP